MISRCPFTVPYILLRIWSGRHDLAEATCWQRDDQGILRQQKYTHEVHTTWAFMFFGLYTAICVDCMQRIRNLIPAPHLWLIPIPFTSRAICRKTGKRMGSLCIRLIDPEQIKDSSDINHIELHGECSILKKLKRKNAKTFFWFKNHGTIHILERNGIGSYI